MTDATDVTWNASGGEVVISHAVLSGPVATVVRMGEEDSPRLLVCVLPEPPSANRYWRRHGYTIYRSKEAKAYVDMVGQVLRPYCGDDVLFPAGADLAVVVLWHRGRKAGDLQNRTKILYDALEGTVYADDNQIAQEHTQRVDAHPTIPKGHVRVEVSAL